MAETKQRFSDEANKVYTYSSAEDLINHTDDLLAFVEHHQTQQVPRLRELQAYYLGNNTTILTGERRKEKHKADNRATHNFGKYVSNFMQGFFVGVPVAVGHEDESVEEQVQEINETLEDDALNAEIELDCSISGRAYELLNRNQNDKVKSYLSSFLDTFVIYDGSVEQNPVAGVRYRTEKKGEDEQLIVELYTDKKIFTYEEANKKLASTGEQNHFFEGVPINEYQNNRFRQGDFEPVLNLIDLYDSAQSDVANYSQDLPDAVLKITGNVELSTEDAQQMYEANMLLLKPGQSVEGKENKVDADYIYKQYDVAGMESYKDRLQTDIHKFTLTPDLSDDNFNGVQSGESMRYKLFGLEQLRISKERMFKRSLQRRYELIGNILNIASEADAGAFEGLTYEFTPNLPKSVTDAINNFVAVGGELSEETKLSIIPMIVEDRKAEMKRLEEGKKQRRQMASEYMEVDN